MLIEKFLSVVEDNSEALALTIGENSWTYKELNSEVLKFAKGIKSLCHFPKRIGLFSFRSKTSYAGTLASMLLGSTFVPLNKNFPVARTVSIIEHAKLDVIVVDSQSIHALRGVLKELSYNPLIIVDSDSDLLNEYKNIYCINDLDTFHIHVGSPKINNDDTAYILFTSGSTGIPKGVQISHGNLNHFIHYNQEKYKVSASDKLSQTFDQTFDLSMFDIFMAFCHGATLCVPQPIELLSPSVFVSENQITIWFSVPSIINFARKKNILRENSMPTLRLSLFCGEPLSVEAVETWQAAAPNSTIQNLYGPTELTIACSSYTYDSLNHINNENGVVSIGEIYAGLKFKILDENLKEVTQDGFSGELCVAGPQNFQGYLDDKEKTLFAHIEKDGEIYYRTGDLVKLSKNNQLIYLGRADQQIKVNGYRVELAEIEWIIRKTPGIIDAVVLGWPIIDGTCAGLVAFLTGEETSSTQILESLRNLVPSYMVPNQILFLEKMPLNANGKIDRKALINYLT